MKRTWKCLFVATEKQKPQLQALSKTLTAGELYQFSSTDVTLTLKHTVLISLWWTNTHFYVTKIKRNWTKERNVYNLRSVTFSKIYSYVLLKYFSVFNKTNSDKTMLLVKLLYSMWLQSLFLCGMPRDISCHDSSSKIQEKNTQKAQTLYKHH